VGEQSGQGAGAPILGQLGREMGRDSKLWEVPDHLWIQIEALLDAVDQKKRRGRPRVDRRRIMDGVLFKIRTACRWNLIPKVYGNDATIHRAFQRWRRLGVFEKVWNLLVVESPELAQLNWQARTLKSVKPEGPPPDAPQS
jgi:transposase